MSNNKQQTAVEWLAEQMLYPEFANPYIEQAKEMEKQQIIKAWKAGDGQHDKVADKLAEQWYEKTYGGNK
jgi:predicted Zn-dependent peptidase